jgi:hypothetical protein
MDTQDQVREELLASVLAELKAAEPDELIDDNPFDCDVLAGDADHTLGMWKISWSTSNGN